MKHFQRALVALVLVTSSSASAAQDAVSRADEWRKLREDKATRLASYSAPSLERASLAIENGNAVLRALSPVKGVYPRIGSFRTGGGFALGVGYRDRTLLDRKAVFDLSTARSLKGYWIAEAKVSFLALAGGRLFADAYAQHRDFPQENFFGLGNAARRRDHATFALRDTTIGASGGLRARRWLGIGGSVESLRPSIGPGTANRLPQVSDLFSPMQAPGLGSSPKFLHTSAFVDVNTREPKGNPRRGGRYRLTRHLYVDRDGGAFDFARTDVDLQQYVSAFHEKRVLAFRGLLSTTDERRSNPPFYLQQFLGGSDTLRGFRDYRFRGPHVMLMQAEYRFEAFTALDMALFVDAGKTTLARRELGFDDLQTDYGFGFRFGTIQGVFLRLDAAFGSADGPHYYMQFGHVF